ncbi:hypothetical protein CNMCM6106_006912 [Aspergillus hiratsukae]|uniref:Uncharacterized protein n=1 Tax=Aspergillus hiratsukae TaxID=1194566 RepID=A0A8H6PRW1_9EURO|nr:hypothetical protein CNMCM6106_006912 [Aspergillus hiratsukae]
MLLHFLPYLVLTAAPSIAIPNPLSSSTTNNQLIKRQTDSGPNTCADISSLDPNCEEICATNPETGELVCDLVCTYSDATYTTSGNFCINIRADTPQGGGRRRTTAIILSGVSITAAGDITINVIGRDPRGSLYISMDGCRLYAGGTFTTNYVDDGQCIAENDCQVVVQERNVRWKSALTGGEERSLSEQVYLSRLDGSSR